MCFLIGNIHETLIAGIRARNPIAINPITRYIGAMEAIADHRALIDTLGGNKVVSDGIDGCTPVRVGQWKLNNRIPPEYWPGIIRLAEALGHSEINSDWLMVNFRPRTMPQASGEQEAAA